MSSEVLIPLAPALDSNANAISGSTLTFYAAGTLTPKSVYSDESLTTSLGNILTADAAGRFVQFWAADGAKFRVQWNDAGGALIKTFENIKADVALSGVSAFGAQLVQSADAAGAKLSLLIPKNVISLVASGVIYNDASKAAANSTIINNLINQLGADNGGTLVFDGSGDLYIGATIDQKYSNITLIGMNALADTWDYSVGSGTPKGTTILPNGAFVALKIRTDYSTPNPLKRMNYAANAMGFAIIGGSRNLEIDSIQASKIHLAIGEATGTESCLINCARGGIDLAVGSIQECDIKLFIRNAASGAGASGGNIVNGVVLDGNPISNFSYAAIDIMCIGRDGHALVAYTADNNRVKIRHIAAGGGVGKPIYAYSVNAIPKYTTAALVAATSATLTANWTLATGAWKCFFSDGTTKSINLTNGSTAVTWSGAITANTLLWIAPNTARGVYNVGFDSNIIDWYASNNVGYFGGSDIGVAGTRNVIRHIDAGNGTPLPTMGTGSSVPIDAQANINGFSTLLFYTLTQAAFGDSDINAGVARNGIGLAARHTKATSNHEHDLFTSEGGQWGFKVNSDGNAVFTKYAGTGAAALCWGVGTALQLAAIPTKLSGMRAFCNDATATTFASILTGGGSNQVPVYYDSSSGWRIG